MTLTLNFNEAETSQIEKFAASHRVDAIKFIKDAIFESMEEREAKRKRDFLAKLQLSERQIEEGKVVIKTAEELERLVHG